MRESLTRPHPPPHWLHAVPLIADADYLVDIGPEAGAAGGKVVAHGTPEQVACNKQSRTAPFLRTVLE